MGKQIADRFYANARDVAEEWNRFLVDDALDADTLAKHDRGVYADALHAVERMLKPDAFVEVPPGTVREKSVFWVFADGILESVRGALRRAREDLMARNEGIAPCEEALKIDTHRAAIVAPTEA